MAIWLQRARAFAGALLLGIFGHASGELQAADTNDDFILGYASAILEHELHVQPRSLTVTNGVIALHAQNLDIFERAKIKTALLAIPGVVGAEVFTDPVRSPWHPEGFKLEKSIPAGGDILPTRSLFQPLIADPRWPHLSSSYQQYQEDEELKNVGAVSLGASIPLFEDDFPGEGRWAMGIEGAVYSVFDLDAPSFDLINSDYWAAFPFSYRWSRFSSMIRLFHQSSHLGDEYLLRSRADRVDLNYEGVDLLFSYDLIRENVRLYAGGGRLLRMTPDDLKPLSAQVGLELRCPYAIFTHFQPVAALDMQSREERNWTWDWSARAGLQLNTERWKGRTLQILLEYYHGHSPNGQFFERNIEYFGFGFHFHL